MLVFNVCVHTFCRSVTFDWILAVTSAVRKIVLLSFPIYIYIFRSHLIYVKFYFGTRLTFMGPHLLRKRKNSGFFCSALFALPPALYPHILETSSLVFCVLLTCCICYYNRVVFLRFNKSSLINQTVVWRYVCYWTLIVNQSINQSIFISGTEPIEQ